MDTRGGDVTGAAAVVTVPDDRPVRHRQARLRRPASWSLGLGAASLAPLSWVVPLVMWVLPGVRISGWDKALHRRRSWTVSAWALAWIPCSAFILGSSGDRTAVPDLTQGWLHVGVFVTTFALWAATVLRLTRAAEVVAHQTGLDA